MDIRNDINRDYSLESFYKLKGLTRQGVSQSIVNQNKKRNQGINLKSLVDECRIKHPKMGSRTLFYTMKNQGISVGMGITKFEQFLSANGMTIGKTKIKWPKTSDGKGKNGYPNLANALSLQGINELIVGDITYFFAQKELFYLFILKDVYSQRILSIVPSRNMEAINCMTGLQEVVQLRKKKHLAGCIHHSDNGGQYEYKLYIKELSKLNMLISRSKACQENGSAEQVNHVVKNMYLYNWTIHNFKELEAACREVKFLNNHERCISQLTYKTPIGFEKYIKTVLKIDRPIKTLYDFNQNNKSDNGF